MILVSQLSISVDNSRLQPRHLGDLWQGNVALQRQFDSFVIPQIAPHATLGMLRAVGDLRLIEALFVKADDLSFVGGTHALVKVIAHGRQRLTRLLARLGQQLTHCHRINAQHETQVGQGEQDRTQGVMNVKQE